MSIDIEALKSSVDIVSVIGSYVALKKRGIESVGLCPFHADNSPSLFVNPQKRIWKCFVCDIGGDVIDFVKEREGIDFKQAVAKLGNGTTWTPKKPIKHEAPIQERVTSKPPDDVPAPDFHIRAIGAPSKVYEIRDVDASLIAYECRYETDGKKEIRIWSWGARGAAAPSWGMGHLNTPRPLYGLERLSHRLGAPVLLTEGPKKADAGDQLLTDYASLSWTGGANAWHKHDWNVLVGRDVLLIPDADEPGIAAAQKLAALLSDPRGLGLKVRIVDPAGQPEGWDIADALAEGWDGNALIAWARPRAKDFERAPEVAPAASTQAPDELPPLAVYEGDGEAPRAPSEPVAGRKRRERPQLATVDGNTVRAPEEQAEAMPAAMSEDALAREFVLQHGENWRHVKEWGRWLEWRGDRWMEDRTSKLEGLAIQTTREAQYWPEAGSLTPREKRQVSKRSTAWALRDIAATDRRVAATTDQWDADKLLLGVPGGVVDLRDGSMVEASREQYISRQTAVAPGNGRPEKWIEYLARVHDGNDEIISYLQRYSGYCCTAETKEHALAFLYGTGRNGKGVFLETISRILGEYARTASIDTFLEKAHAAHTTELARLHGARLVITEEAASGGRWNEARIKHVTGGGKITAHFMRQDDFEFTPTFKLLVAANHKPMLRSVDEAIKARIHLVPFKITIPAEERDKDLLAKLEAEWPQILGWMLDGCAEWQLGGLRVPASIVEATEQYVEAEDVLGQWLEECCERDDARLEGAAGYKSYDDWCERQGERAMSRRSWSNAMVERGFAPCKGSGGTRMFDGVRLKATHS